MSVKLLSAIVFFADGRQPAKYRNIPDSEPGVNRLIKFVKREFMSHDPKAINFYNKNDRSFNRQIKL